MLLHQNNCIHSYNLLFICNILKRCAKLLQNISTYLKSFMRMHWSVKLHILLSREMFKKVSILLPCIFKVLKYLVRKLKTNTKIIDCMSFPTSKWIGNTQKSQK